MKKELIDKIDEYFNNLTPIQERRMLARMENYSKRLKGIHTFDEFKEVHGLNEFEYLGLTIKEATREYLDANGEGSYINSSYVGDDEIVLGIYEDDENKLISMFHEIGHILLDKLTKENVFPSYEKYMLDNKHMEDCINSFGDGFGVADSYTYHVEQMSWILGLNLAKSNYDIEFSQNSIQWAKQQLATYTTITGDCGR